MHIIVQSNTLFPNLIKKKRKRVDKAVQKHGNEIPLKENLVNFKKIR